MKRMDLAEIVDGQLQRDLEKVFFGAWISLFDLKDESEHAYRIVGKDEIAPTQGYISWVSPLAKSLLGRTVGDTVRVISPSGESLFEILDIQYTPPAVK